MNQRITYVRERLRQKNFESIYEIIDRMASGYFRLYILGISSSIELGILIFSRYVCTL